MTATLQIDRVRQATFAHQATACQSTLDTQVHPALGLLNTCLTCPRVWAGRLRIVSSLAKSQAGDFPLQCDSATSRALCLLNRVWRRDGHLFFDSSRNNLVPYPRTGAWSGQWNTRNRIARKGAGGGWDMVETPAHEFADQRGARPFKRESSSDPRLRWGGPAQETSRKHNKP